MKRIRLLKRLVVDKHKSGCAESANVTLGEERVQTDSFLTIFHLNSVCAGWNDKLLCRKWLFNFNQFVWIIQLFVCVWQSLCSLG